MLCPRPWKTSGKTAPNSITCPVISHPMKGGNLAILQGHLEKQDTPVVLAKPQWAAGIFAWTQHINATILLPSLFGSSLEISAQECILSGQYHLEQSRGLSQNPRSSTQLLYHKASSPHVIPLPSGGSGWMNILFKHHRKCLMWWGLNWLFQSPWTSSILTEKQKSSDFLF